MCCCGGDGLEGLLSANQYRTTTLACSGDQRRGGILKSNCITHHLLLRSWRRRKKIVAARRAGRAVDGCDGKTVFSLDLSWDRERVLRADAEFTTAFAVPRSLSNNSRHFYSNMYMYARWWAYTIKPRDTKPKPVSGEMKNSARGARIRVNIFLSRQQQQQHRPRPSSSSASSSSSSGQTCFHPLYNFASFFVHISNSDLLSCRATTLCL